MPLPFARECLVMKPSDLAQSNRTRNSRDILPLLVSLQNLLRHRCALLVDATMLEDLPHAILCICYIWHVKQPHSECGLTCKVTGDHGVGEGPPVGVRVDRWVRGTFKPCPNGQLAAGKRVGAQSATMRPVLDDMGRGQRR